MVTRMRCHAPGWAGAGRDWKRLRETFTGADALVKQTTRRGAASSWTSALRSAPRLVTLLTVARSMREAQTIPRYLLRVAHQTTCPDARRFAPNIRAGGRAVDCTGLENRQTCKRLGGSNPSLPAYFLTTAEARAHPSAPAPQPVACRSARAAHTAPARAPASRARPSRACGSGSRHHPRESTTPRPTPWGAVDTPSHNASMDHSESRTWRWCSRTLSRSVSFDGRRVVCAPV